MTPSATQAMPDPANLPTLLNHLWQQLRIGATDPAHDWHWPVLATVAPAGDSQMPLPDARTVILRAASPNPAWLDIHSDSQAAKCEQLRHQPVAMLTSYWRSERVQIRLRGPVQQHHSDTLAEQAFAALTADSRSQYQGIHQFTILRLHVHSIDWLSLATEPHQRARFYRIDNSAVLFDGRYITP